MGFGLLHGFIVWNRSLIGFRGQGTAQELIGVAAAAAWIVPGQYRGLDVIEN